MNQTSKAASYDSRVDTFQHIQTVQVLLGTVIADLQQRQLTHDQSKLVAPEREVFDEYTPKLATSTYGSDEYKGFLEEMKAALEHHYAHNDHHPEHFEDDDWAAMYSAGDPPSRWARAPLQGVAAMDLVQLIEMLCDWKAATLRHNDGDILKSIEINQQRFGYSDELKQLLLNTLPLIDIALKK